MKYAVEVAGEQFEVEFCGDSILIDGRPTVASLEPDGAANLHRLFMDDRGVTAEIERVAGGWRVQIAGEHRDVQVVDERVQRLRELTGGSGAASAGEILKAPMPGMILRLQVEIGQEVEAGQGVLVLEAMKMENEIRASTSGVVAAIHAEVGTAVEKGTPLVVIEPVE